jgi:signal transduction histidine kinase/CheY-like chemotaxis protein
VEASSTTEGLARALEAERSARLAAEAGRLREAVLAEVSTLLVSNGAEPFADVLRLLGEAHRVDRAYLFLVREDNGFWDNAYEWCRPGVDPQIENLQGLDPAELPWWRDWLQTGTPLVIQDLSQLPLQAFGERRLLEAQSIRSLLVVPLADPDEGILGFMGFDRVRNGEPWSAEDQRAIEIVARMSARQIAGRRSALALQRSQERYHLAGLATRDLIYDCDLDSNQMELGGGGSTALGLADLRRVSIEWWEERIHPDERERILADLAAAIAGDAPGWEAAYRFRKGDGTTWAHILERGYFVRDSEGRAIRMVGVMSDRSPQARMEEELRHAQKMQAVGSLAAGVAHEFNNLLAVVLGYAELLSETPGLGPEQVEAAGEIREAAIRGSLLTGQLLAFGRKHVAFSRPVPVAETVARMGRLFQRVLPESVRVQLENLADGVHVHADPAQIEQVLLNLAVNARDAMPRGGTLILRTMVVAEGRVQIEVEDSGEGMTDAVRSRAFEPFFTTKAQGEGTGLGLPTVYGIIRALGGRVWIESRPGPGPEAGTRVTMELPTSLLPSEPEEAPPTPAGSAARSHLASLNASGRVLLVEDDPGVSDICRRILVQAGFDVRAARDRESSYRVLDGMGAEGRASLQLLLTDIGLPGPSGPEMVAELRQSFPELADLPVLYMSGYTATTSLRPVDSHREAGEGGGEPGDSGSGHVPVLSKPFPAAALLQAVARVLGSD